MGRWTNSSIVQMYMEKYPKLSLKKHNESGNLLKFIKFYTFFLDTVIFDTKLY